MQLTSRSAVRGVAPHDVADAVEAYLDHAGLAHTRSPALEPGPDDLVVAGEQGGWTTVTWPPYFTPHDLAACRRLSGELHTLVSAVTTTDDEGWSHTLFACGTELDRFHSFPSALVWDGEDVAAVTREWSGDFELVARVLGVEAGAVRRHFCQATAARREHPGRERDGYLGLWSSLGIRPLDRRPAHAVIEVDPAWLRAAAR